MRYKTLEFNCFGCRMTLNMPDAMEEITITKLRKFFRFIDEEFWKNEDSVRDFFSYIPEIQDDLKAQWHEASMRFQHEYQDPNFKNGERITDKTERDARKASNDRLMERVKRAKTRYEKFVKKIPKLEELKTTYLH